MTACTTDSWPAAAVFIVAIICLTLLVASIAGVTPKEPKR